MIRKTALAFAISSILAIPVSALAESAPPDTAAPPGVHVVEVKAEVKKSSVIRESIYLHKNARPTNAFWDELAQCETGQNWRDGGKYGGGLGIYIGTWTRFGGREFASRPSGATREEQIVVANRIAVDGYQTKNTFKTLDDKMNNNPYHQAPVGLGGWGCYKSKSTGKYRMAKPRMYHADKPHLVPLASFSFGEKSPLVRDLQTYLRIVVDGEYGPKTRKAHIAWLKKRGLSTEGVPAVVSRSVG